MPGVVVEAALILGVVGVIGRVVYRWVTTRRITVSQRNTSDEIADSLEEWDGIIRGRWRDRGASAVEYGLLVAAVAAVIVGVSFELGHLLQGAFSQTCAKIAASAPVPGSNCTGTPTP
jgi:pilus assembly protein Flp/PilA